MKSKLLIFHPTIAPYRIDFFNDLYKAFDTRICLQYKNLKSQNFDYDKITAQFLFVPIYLKLLFDFRGRSINRGYFKQLNKFRPEIVVVSEFGLDCLFTLFHRFVYRRKYKIVSLCDDSYNMVAEDNDLSFVHRVLRSLVTPLLDEIVLVEPKVTEWYQEHYNKGICFPIIKKEQAARKVYESLVSLSQQTCQHYHLYGKKIFVFVGRLVKIKNVDLAIKAYARVETADTAFVIIGNGPEENYLHTLSNQLCKNVIFTGRLEGDELLQWYNIAQCFVLPSYLEPFGAVTNEALLAGCFSLISKSAGSQCLIKNGVNGYTFDPMNQDELIECMSKALEKVSVLDFIKLKDNLMQVGYDDIMENLVYRLSN